jgi:hypothetical protein
MTTAGSKSAPMPSARGLTGWRRNLTGPNSEGGCVESTRQIGDKTSTESRYFLCSFPARDRSAANLALIHSMAQNVLRQNGPPRDSIRRRKPLPPSTMTIGYASCSASPSQLPHSAIALVELPVLFMKPWENSYPRRYGQQPGGCRPTKAINTIIKIPNILLELEIHILIAD